MYICPYTRCRFRGDTFEAMAAHVASVHGLSFTFK